VAAEEETVESMNARTEGPASLTLPHANNGKRKELDVESVSQARPETVSPQAKRRGTLDMVLNQAFNPEIRSHSEQVDFRKLSNRSNMPIFQGDYFIPYNQKIATNARFVKKIGSGGTGAVCLVYPLYQ